MTHFKTKLIGLFVLGVFCSCTDDDGIVESDDFVDLLQPRISLISSEPAVGTEVFFSDVSRGDIIDRLWVFDNGDSSRSENPSTIYDQEGDYTVSLTVTDTDNVTEETSIGITVGPLFIEGAYVLDDSDYEFIAGLGNDAQNEDMLNSFQFDIQPESNSYWSQADIASAIDQLLLSKDPFDTLVLPVMYRVFDGESARTTFSNFTFLESNYRQYVEYNTINTDYLYMAQFGDDAQEPNMLQHLNFWRQRPTDPRYWFDNQLLNALTQLLLSRFEVADGSVYSVEIAFYDGDQKRMTTLLVFNGETFELHPDGTLP